MKTLVIHPEDRSTDFLKPVYEPVRDKTVITGGISRLEVTDLIRSHDRIMIMGHGSPRGLLSAGRFPDEGSYIVDDDMAYLLKTKVNNVYIWCYADMYVKHHELEGFCSGMFVSEVDEAELMGLGLIDQSIVDSSNIGFSSIVGRYINESSLTGSGMLCEKVKLDYGLLSIHNPVAQYNNERLYYNLNK